MPAPSVFDVLLESATGAPRCRLEEEYGAALLVEAGRVAVNFVSTIDGIVSLGLAGDDSWAIGGGVAADRQLMAMLRAIAGVIVIGAGNLRATLNHQWTPQALAPEREDDLATLRAQAGLPAPPAPLLVVSASGDIPVEAEAIAHPAVPVHILSSEGVREVAGSARPSGVDPTAGEIRPAAIVEAARELAGGGPILCEGGPHLLGSLLGGRIPLDLFLTVAPQLVGRGDRSTERRSLVEGIALPPFRRLGTLRSVRRSQDHLLLRYAVDAAPGSPS
jgi:riboflavin biosynthesis pyrimidine reductase